jgi:RNA polymerase-associated protein RTF1
MADIDLTTALFAMADGYESDKDKTEERAVSPHHSLGSRSHSRSPRSHSRSPYHSPRHSRPRSPQSYRSRSYSRSPATMPHRDRSLGRTRRNDSVEEGEDVSAPGSPGSLGSGAMDESDSESDSGRGASPAEHDPLAREQRLADIAEQADERERMDQLKGLFDERSKPQKRKLDAYDDEPKRSTRPRTSITRKDESSSRSRTIKKARKSEFSDGDSESGVKKADPVAELVDYQRIRVGRSNFPQVCFDPYFEDRIAGCFVRVAFNRDPTTGENIYRMCEIRSRLPHIFMKVATNLRQA